MDCEGQVTDINTEKGQITVVMKRVPACDRCGACKTLNEQEIHIQARNACGAVLHDRVRVALAPGFFWSALSILYGIPFAGLMLGFFAGMYIGQRLGLGEYAALMGFLLGIGLTGLGYKFIRKAEKGKKRAIPVAVEVVNYAL